MVTVGEPTHMRLLPAQRACIYMSLTMLSKAWALKLLTRGASRALSSNVGAGGISDRERDSMVEYMRNIAQKREAAGGKEASGTLWSKLNMENAGSRSSPKKFGNGNNRPARDNNRPAAGNNAEAGGRPQSSDASGKIYNSRNTGRPAAGGRPGGRGGNTASPANRGPGGAGQGQGGARRKSEGVWDEGSAGVGGAWRGPEEDGDQEDRDFDKRFADEDGNAFSLGGGAERHVQLDAVDIQMLNSHEFLQEMVDKGVDGIDTEDFDAVDEFIADAVTECFKSPDHTFIEVLETPELRRTQVPQPRSLAQLQAFCRPPVLQNSPADSAGAQLAAQAWGVIHKNYYYRDSEKYRMVERIATLHDQLERHLRAREQDEEGVDLVLQNGFRKGCDFWEEEERLKLLNAQAPAADNRFLQAETDWSVEAVVDEDQL